MSKIGDLVGKALGGAAVGIGAQVVSALFMTGRSIGGIIPDVVVEEHHTDTMSITDHPVETGAPISDHAFVNPAEVSLHVAWSNSKSIANSIVSGSLFSGTINDVNDVYRQLLALQKSAATFDLVTGKRTYSDMLIKSLAVTTDKDTENALSVTAVLRQVIKAQTVATALALADAHASPEDTAAPTSAGTKQPAKAQNQSALFTLFGGGP